MKIRGIKTAKNVVVDLSKYFDSPTSVTIRPLTVPTRAEIQELTTSGVRYATQQLRNKLDIEAIEQSMPADITLKVRELKLADAYVAHDILNEEDGTLAPWGKPLWDALDEADPRILAKVIEAISDLSYPDEEDGADPTSPAESGEKSSRPSKGK